MTDRGLCSPLGVAREYLTIRVSGSGMTVEEAKRLGLRRPSGRQALHAALGVATGEWMFAFGLDERAAAAALDDELASRAVTAA